MKKLFQFVPTYLVLFLIIGIFTGFYFLFNPKLLAVFLLLEWILLFVLYIKWKNRTFFSLYFSLLTFVISFTVGISTITFKNQLNSNNHYIQLKNTLTTNKKFENQLYDVRVVVDKVLNSSAFYQKYEVKIVTINQQKYRGKVLLNVLKDSTKKGFQVDDQLQFLTIFKPIEPPKNPYYFDYQNYLKKQQIHHQLVVSSSDVKIMNESDASLKGLAAKFRTKINEKLVPFDIAKDELGVINGLLLGQRHDISKDLMESYSNAGAIHILAVSGLHIGIILMILQILLKPLERIKNGRIYKIFLLVLLLWIYALIAGLSASVVRAVMMFSVVAVGMNLQKSANIFYTLIVSMLILLLINPYFLFDVGFQLSYAAVFSIVIVQPILNSFWFPKNKILNFYWNLLTVSMAAQIGVLPLSLYYFHQFPGLFFITNLVIIPFLGIILMGGIFIFALALLNALPAILVKLYSLLIFGMNWVVKWVSDQESFLIREIPFNFWILISVSIVFIGGIIFMKVRRKQHLQLFLITIIGFQLVLFLTKWKTENSDEFIVFHKSKQAMIAEKIGKELFIYAEIDSINLKKEKFLTAFIIGNSMDKTQIRKPQNVYYRGKQLILVIDKSGIYQLPELKPDIIILQHSPKINLNRLIEQLQPKQIVADGTNFTSYIKNWEITCKQTKTPFHHTGQKGAFILK